VEFDPEFSVVYRSSQAKRVFGLNAEEILGKRMEENGLAITWGRCDPALSNRHGELVSVLSGLSDITKRKRAEEGLKESEEKFRVLAQSMPMATMLCQNDRVGRCKSGGGENNRPFLAGAFQNRDNRRRGRKGIRPENGPDGACKPMPLTGKPFLQD
jgi:PAS domain-containing protein